MIVTTAHRAQHRATFTLIAMPMWLAMMTTLRPTTTFVMKAPQGVQAMLAETTHLTTTGMAVARRVAPSSRMGSALPVRRARFARTQRAIMVLLEKLATNADWARASTSALEGANNAKPFTTTTA